MTISTTHSVDQNRLTSSFRITTEVCALTQCNLHTNTPTGELMLTAFETLGPLFTQDLDTHLTGALFPIETT